MNTFLNHNDVYDYDDAVDLLSTLVMTEYHIQLKCDTDYLFTLLRCAIGWRLGVTVSIFGLVNEVAVRWARLVPGWVTVLRRANHLQPTT